ncbi:MAG: TetR/AcrR family transcriptional regulator [Novosphingobium sp.]
MQAENWSAVVNPEKPPKNVPPIRPSAGRPTREQSLQRRDELLDCALDSFLEHGFEQATMELIATAIGMSKRTVYAYYGDKEALFRAAVERAIERYTVPREALDALIGHDLEQTLRAVGRLRVANIASHVSTTLQRILAAQSHRFPDLFNAAFTRGAGPTIAFLVDLFARHQARGGICVPEPERAAVAFLSLVVSGPARIIVSGNPLSDEEIEARIGFGVGLFLNGIRVRRNDSDQKLV